LQEQSGTEQVTPTEINNDSHSPAYTSLSSLVGKQPPAKKQKMCLIAKQNELLELACDFLSKDSKTTGVEGDEYLTIAKVWGNTEISAPHTAQNSRKLYMTYYSKRLRELCAEDP